MTRFGLSGSYGWLILALTVLHIIPIWIFTYFPSQDGPSHVDSAYVLLHYFDDGSVYDEYFDINVRPVPTWFSHLVMAGLMFFLPPLAAEKVLLTAYVLVFVLSLVYFLRSVGEKKLVFFPIAFLFLNNLLIHRGSYNFAFSFPLVFMALGYWWRRRDEPLKPGFIVSLNALLVLLYFCHIASQLLAIGSILLLGLVHYRRCVRKTFRLAACLIPAYLLPINYVQARQVGHVSSLPLTKLISQLLLIDPLTYHDVRQRAVGAAVAVLLGVLVFRTAWVRLGGLRQNHGQTPGQSPGHLHFDEHDSFLLLSVAFTFLYLVMPLHMLGGGGLSHRLNLFPYVAIVPWLDPLPGRCLKHAVTVSCVILILIQLGITTYYQRILNHGLEEYTSGISLVDENRTILPINTEHRGASARVEVYRHAVGYYCAAKGAVNLANYEAGTDYFPLKYKPALNPYRTMGRLPSATGRMDLEAYPGSIDYIIVWSQRDRIRGMAWIERNYRLIHTQGRLRLYKHRALGDSRRSGPPT